MIQLAQEILAKFGSLQAIAQATIHELCQFKGLGVTKAAQIKASITLGLRAAKPVEPPKYFITNSFVAYQIVKNYLKDARSERFLAILLDAKCGAIATELIAIGTLSKTLVHPREAFCSAIRHNAASLILVHNHPSGDPNPSQEDLDVTLMMIEAGKMLSIPVQDHLIVGEDRYISLRNDYTFLNF